MWMNVLKALLIVLMILLAKISQEDILVFAVLDTHGTLSGLLAQVCKHSNDNSAYIQC